jgi:hypothetical protein
MRLTMLEVAKGTSWQKWPSQENVHLEALKMNFLAFSQ